MLDRKSTRLNSSHTEIYTLSLHDALPISLMNRVWELRDNVSAYDATYVALAEFLGCPLLTADARSEEHTSELQSHRDLHSFPTRRSSDLADEPGVGAARQRVRIRRDLCRAR